MLEQVVSIAKRAESGCSATYQVVAIFQYYNPN